MIEYNKIAKSMESSSDIINRGIIEHLKANYSGELLKILKYASSDGKHLRGILLKKTSEQFNGDTSIACRLAVSIELGHSASLVHDDIMDHSKSRRGSRSFWSKYGIEKAVIVPHILISDALGIAIECGNGFADLSVRTWNRASIGQYMDFVACAYREKYEYGKIIDLKSASLFECAFEMGAMSSSESESLLKEARQTGRRIGIIYQMIDDFIGSIKKEKGGSTSLFGSYIKNKGGAYDYIIREIKGSLKQIKKNRRFRFDGDLESYVLYSIVKKFEEGGSRISRLSKAEFDFA